MFHVGLWVPELHLADVEALRLADDWSRPLGDSDQDQLWYAGYLALRILFLGGPASCRPREESQAEFNGTLGLEVGLSNSSIERLPLEGDVERCQNTNLASILRMLSGGFESVDTNFRADSDIFVHSVKKNLLDKMETGTIARMSEIIDSESHELSYNEVSRQKLLVRNTVQTEAEEALKFLKQFFVPARKNTCFSLAANDSWLTRRLSLQLPFLCDHMMGQFYANESRIQSASDKIESENQIECRSMYVFSQNGGCDTENLGLHSGS